MTDMSWVNEFEGKFKGGVGHFKIFHTGPQEYVVIDLTITGDDPIVRHYPNISECYREAQALWDAYRETLQYCLETEFPGETFTEFAVMTWRPLYLIEEWDAEWDRLRESGNIALVGQKDLGAIYDYNA